MMFVECTDRCIWGDNCGNRVLQEGVKVPVEVYKLSNGHLGLRSKSIIKPNDIVIEYKGEVINNAMLDQRRRQLEASSDELSYFLAFYENLYIDSKYKGNVSRFANHSCSPNCEVFIFNSGCYRKAALVSNKTIQAEEPITFSYGRGSQSKILL